MKNHETTAKPFQKGDRVRHENKIALVVQTTEKNVQIEYAVTTIGYEPGRIVIPIERVNEFLQHVPTREIKIEFTSDEKFQDRIRKMRQRLLAATEAPIRLKHCWFSRQGSPDLLLVDLACAFDPHEVEYLEQATSATYELYTY